ncbi:helix-turn-helix domain-containing protein [Altererythrobacter sp. CC-YST694]|uniref:transcriptional regulator n=1 Tax=Altererythrobacter sp. CC-YST694 TaxID=2755038 RepID=UPI001D0137F6|nr:YdaS family helix-turn-helix protein [Altererythrobacter sp. CC-YST694]MCB5423938.1 helix-turn-helix domain-containing protein [Altererythrobacter sp. CC-YST694]
MEHDLTPLEALELAVTRAGSQSALARICRVGQPAVWKWLQSSKRIPAQHVIAVEFATNVSRHQLRPDIYPLEPALPASAIGEEAPLCGPILSAHALAKYGNLAKYMDEREVAA